MMESKEGGSLSGGIAASINTGNEKKSMDLHRVDISIYAFRLHTNVSKCAAPANPAGNAGGSR